MAPFTTAYGVAIILRPGPYHCSSSLMKCAAIYGRNMVSPKEVTFLTHNTRMCIYRGFLFVTSETLRIVRQNTVQIHTSSTFTHSQVTFAMIRPLIPKTQKGYVL